MSNRGVSIALLSWACSVVLVPCANAMTLDYATGAAALAEVGWWDYWQGNVFLPVEDGRQADNASSQAHAYWNFAEMASAGKIDIGIAASAKNEPNQIVLTTKVSGSYKMGSDWTEINYFYQVSQGYVDGWLQIDELPAGTPCSLHLEATWPQDTWTGEYYWHFEAASDVDWMQCGYDPNGPYGPRSGSITAFAGEPVYVYLATRGGGYAEPGGPFSLGRGDIQLDLVLTVRRHIADLKADGIINFEDFAVFAHQWRKIDPPPDQTAEWTAADFDGSGTVDANDLGYLTYWWLLSPRPAADAPAQ
jgi:hypothetical protein